MFSDADEGFTDGLLSTSSSHHQLHLVKDRHQNEQQQQYTVQSLNNNNGRGEANNNSLITPSPSVVRSGKSLRFTWLLISFKIVVVSVDTVLYNRIAHKMVNYEWFLSQMLFPISTCLMILPALLWQRYTGRLTDKDLAYPWKRFAILGALAGLNNFLSTFPSAVLPGAFDTLIGKLTIPATMIMSYLILKKQYLKSHYIGASLVVIGASLSVFEHFQLPNADDTWAVFIGIGTKFNTVSVWQEMLMKDGNIGVLFFRFQYALWEILFGIVTLPSIFIKIPHQEQVTLHTFWPQIEDSWLCFTGSIDGVSGACQDTWKLWIVYMLFNILYQISNLMITKHVSAAVSEMSSALAVPLEILLFMWPFLAGLAYSPDGLSWYTCVATVLVVAGNVLYTRTTEGQSGQVTLLKNSQTEQQETDDDDTALNY